MVDACSSLTLEDVGKNDMILNLRRDLQRVEENYQKLIQRCQYKDSIIMALRKQIKMLKGEGFSPLNLQSHIPKIPGSVWHKCCPYVKDVCPLYKKTNISHLPSAADFERLKSALKIYSSDGIQNTAIDDDQTPTHDSLIPVPVFPHYERAKSFSADDSKKHKQKTKLTATGVLHEYYDLKESEKLQRSLEVSSKIANKIDITVPNHVSVKTFVHNFERTAFFKTDNNEEKLKTEDTSK